MKKRFLLPALLSAALILSALNRLSAAVPPEDLAAIDARAAELAALIPAEPVPLFPPITDREKWEKFASLFDSSQIVISAEKLLGQPVPELPEDLYKEYFRNGNRTHFQRARNIWLRRCMTLAMAELIENRGRFLPALEEMIRNWCAYPSWVLPAHDPGGPERGGSVYDGTLASADLAATDLAGQLGLIAQSMAPVLPPDLVRTVEENIRRRVLDPLREKVYGSDPVGMWWVTGTNNWNPVCFAGTTAAALSVCETAEERAWFLAAAEQLAPKYFFEGITGDGYCSEGIGYWNYGFSHYVLLAESAWRASGAVNLYTHPKVRPLTEFALKMEVAPDSYAAFADCSLAAKPDKALLALLSRRLGLGLTELERGRAYPQEKADLPVNAAVYFFGPLEAGGELAPLVTPAAETRDCLAEPVSRFPDAGVVICRPAEKGNAAIAAVFKGGHNGEMHNHNDVGTFCVLRGGVWLICDPGGETYTRRTFSPQRYEGELLNSFGHPVPRINGKLQATGRQAEAKVVEFSDTEEATVCTLDLTSAYPDAGVEKVTRRFEFARGGAGRITVTDTVTFAPGAETEAEFPLITFEDRTPADEKTLLITPRPAKDGSVGPGIRVTAAASDENGNPVPAAYSETTVGENDPLTTSNPSRPAWTARLAEGRTLKFSMTVE
ncbi:MAG: heparinase II/III-family protein [Thermoguttaceae bacterium]|nr:heparinase II/III-family protein [Thermoguttaceae bacterium]